MSQAPIVLPSAKRRPREERGRDVAATVPEVSYRLLATRAPIGLFQLTGDGACSFVNDAWSRLTGLSPSESLGYAWIAAVHPADRGRLEAARRDAGRTRAEWTLECRAALVGPTVRWLRFQVAPVLDPDGTVAAFLGTVTDVSEHKRVEEVLRQRVRQDLLTELPNRLHLREALDAALHLARVSDRAMALLFMDLDAFKEINDTLGHEVGDRLLVQVARRLAGAVRSTDTVARLGGDEFAIVLPATDHGEGARVVAENVLRALEAPFVLDGQHVAVSASIGIALYPEHGAEDPDLLMRQADLAMYSAKRERLGVAFFDPLLLEHGGPAVFSRLAELRTAIEEGQLVLHYQPWLRARDGHVTAAEALVRWQHPVRGLLPPADFLPLAEQSGLIRSLDLHVLHAACGQIATWRGGPMDGVRIAVNVSRASLLDEQFPASLAAELIRHRLEGPELELEITENGVFGDPDQATWLAERLSALGVGLAIDDFGTGYSSLSQLRYLRADTLKIDRRFVTAALRVPDDAAIVETVLALGHRFGKEVVAEGVEDGETQAMLERLGVDYVQGFHISHPLPVGDLEAWIASRNGGSAG